MIVSLHLFVGVLAGLLPTFALSRLALWALPHRHGVLPRLVAAHAVSWLACALIGTAFLHTPGEPFGLRAAVTLLFPQLCWLIFDSVRHQVTVAAADTPAAAPVRARRRLI
jgi:hypothetical protein